MFLNREPVGIPVDTYSRREIDCKLAEIKQRLTPAEIQEILDNPDQAMLGTGDNKFITKEVIAFIVKHLPGGGGDVTEATDEEIRELFD